MTLILSGTDNSATTPAMTGGTAGTSTGVYYPATNQVAIATNGTQAMLVDANQNVTFVGVVGTTSVFFENGQTVSANYTVSSGKNAGSFGPVTVATGATVTVPTGSTWSVV